MGSDGSQLNGCMMSDTEQSAFHNKIDTTYLSLTGQDLWGDLNTDLDSLSLSERSNIVELDRQLHAHWGLGRNFILGWCITPTDI